MTAKVKGALIVFVLLGVVVVGYFSVEGLGQTRNVAKVEPTRFEPNETAYRPKMVHLEPGPFIMGSPKFDRERDVDEYIHAVTLTRGFWLSESEVTQGQWSALMKTQPAFFAHSEDHLRHPVERVNWFDALTYANRVSKQEGLQPCYTLAGCRGSVGLGCKAGDVFCTGAHQCRAVQRRKNCDGYRLPTEAEWEYAARAGTSGARYDDPIHDIAWCYDRDVGTHPVMQKRPNARKLYDMLGNVYEWTEEAWREDLRSLKTDPFTPWTEGPITTRGGGWYSEVRLCRAANRAGDAPDYQNYNIGIRLARSLHAPEEDGR